MAECLYRCRHCKRIYGNEADANRCEASHRPLTIWTIIHYEYDLTGVGSTFIPETVHCRLSDGRAARYKLVDFDDNPIKNNPPSPEDLERIRNIQADAKKEYSPDWPGNLPGNGFYDR